MSTPARKGYRAALKLAQQMKTPDRDAVAGFVSWFYNKNLGLVSQDIQALPTPTDAELYYPRYPFQTAASDARALLTRCGGRSAAIRELDGMLSELHDGRITFTNDDDHARIVGYWTAVGRLVTTDPNATD